MFWLLTQQLTTKKLGRLVLHTDVITSTMDVTKGQFLDPCLVVIAARQTTGRGTITGLAHKAYWSASLILIVSN